MKWFTKGYITGDSEWIFGERDGAIRGLGDGLLDEVEERVAQQEHAPLLPPRVIGGQ